MEEPGHCEREKVTVGPEVCGKRISFKLGQAIISCTRKLGGTHLYLESDIELEPVINLYRKLRFKEVRGRYTPYNRCNIKMQLTV